MSTHRIYFRDERGLICGREDFNAGTEAVAIHIARELADPAQLSAVTLNFGMVTSASASRANPAVSMSGIRESFSEPKK